MTKTLLYKLLFVFLLLSGTTQAQTYNPLLGNYNEWDVYVNMIPVAANNAEQTVLNMPYQSGAVTTSDTIINAVPYKKVYSISDAYTVWGSGHPRFLREDTTARKVYLLSADSLNERILYDFSMSVGDSVYLSWEYPSTNAFNSGYYRLDSTGLVTTYVGVRTIYYLSSHANQVQPFQPIVLEWIEGIGSTISPVYLDEDFGNGFANYFVTGCYKYYLALTCAYTDSVQTYRDSCMSVFYNFYVSNMNDSCIYNITGGLNENKLFEVSLQFSPNPVETSTNITFNGKNLHHYKKLNLKMYNTLGVTVKSFELNANDLSEGVTLLRDNLKAGLYTIQIFDNGKLISAAKLMLD